MKLDVDIDEAETLRDALLLSIDVGYPTPGRARLAAWLTHRIDETRREQRLAQLRAEQRRWSR